MKNSFLQQVVDDLIQQYGMDNLHQCTLVFPMHRAGLFVKKCIEAHLPANSFTPLVLPDFTTIDSLVDSMCDLKADDEITSVCTLYEIYQQHTHHQLPIDAFYGWGVQLLNDFSSTDMALVDSKDFMHNTSLSKQYEQTILDEEVRNRLYALIHPQEKPLTDSIREYFEELWKVLPNIYNDFQKTQEENGTGTRGARYRWVISHFTDEAIQHHFQGRQYVFVGFNYLLEAEHKLMQLFNAQGQARFYWDLDKNFQLDDTVYHFINEHITKSQFANSLPCTEEPHSPAKITAIASQSSAAQAQYVHDWLLANHKKGDKTAVVVADESILQSILYALPTQDELNEKINITKGYPLRGTMLYGYVNQLLQDMLHQQTTAEGLLQSLIDQLYQHYHQNTEDVGSESWQKVLLDESYYQIQLVLRQLFLLLQKNDLIREELKEPRVIVNLIRRKLAMMTIPFHGEPVTDIQIIGVLETRLLDFDHVLILNVEEDIVPSRTSDRSFLPYDLRRAYKMATREEESRIYAYNFFRLFRRAKDVTLTFSDASTDMGKRTMSRFLMQMLCSPDYTIEKKRLIESAKTQPFAIQETKMTQDKVLRLSPSSISTYIECPREFYFSKILGLSDSSIDEIVLPFNTLGSICHAVLRHAYMTICKGHLDPNNHLTHSVKVSKEMIEGYMNNEKALATSLEWAYADVNTEFVKYHPEAEIKVPYILNEHQAENHAIMEMVKKVLRDDMAQTPFELVWLEKELSISLDGLTIHGVIDRLDVIGEGKDRYIRVLDYKTGGYSDDKIKFNYTNLFQDTHKKYVLQTFIYSEMVRLNLKDEDLKNLPIRPELFFIKTKKDANILRFEPTKESTETAFEVRDYKDCQTDFMKEFENITKKIKENCQPGQEFAMQADEKICGDSYCPFHLLCGRKKTKK